MGGAEYDLTGKQPSGILGSKEPVNLDKKERHMGEIIEHVEQVLSSPNGSTILRRESLPLAKLFTEKGTSTHEPGVVCPLCGDSYVATTDYRQVDGAEILHFRGECGHTFALVLEFHKGETVAYLVRGPGEPPPDDV